ncbi:diguanylate cyclase [Oceanobacillus sp. J11TS1]|uniref:GGDEF domain-containing protein n=1 Tax=Oceanobacillus sp. J11TS1 TaxID=2807191 RepID=UPI001B020B45|nr:diguanylate cyclase [Oceanobacillus sp. J11TS1]GIO24208.1 GGDEF domain-containing protein [Oceanobacillus sp. J11TS1]
MGNGNLLFYFLDDFFISLCVIITLIVIYLPLRTKLKLDDKPFWHKGIIDGFVCGLFGIILMLFSTDVPGHLVDLRFIPIMLLILFEAAFPAAIGSVVIMIGRFILDNGTDFAMTTPILMTMLFIGFLFIDKLYHPKQPSYRKSLVMILFSNITFIIIMVSDFRDFLQQMRFMPAYFLLSIIGGLTAVFFIKYLSKTEVLISKYQEEVATDFLTGLQNMRSFEKNWGKLVQTAITKKEKLTLLTIDIDYFKQINDTYGHPAGNHILTGFSDILTKNIRSCDVAFRNGGDEFSVALPGCALSDALEVAERIRKEVEACPFKISRDQAVPVTVSISVATYPDTCTSHDQIVQAADKCLYKAKLLGKNRVYPSETPFRKEVE